MDDIALLHEYASHSSEEAFEKLVTRRIGFVYSAALRQVRDPHLAEEVAQAVFIILAQKAGRISERTILTGWLFKTTRFAALAQMRAAAKRREREQEAKMQTEIDLATPDPVWEQMAPMLDEALASLGETDRQAILLRFFEVKGLAEVGKILKTSEDSARKRVTRALEKLRKYFSRRGVVSTSAIIAAGISANSVQAAPVTLAKSVSAMALGKGAAATVSGLTLVKGTLKMMTWIKCKTIAGVSASVLLIGTVALSLAQNITKKETAAIVPTAVAVTPQPPAANMPAMAVANADDELSPSYILAKVALAYADLSTYRDTGWTVHQNGGYSWTNTFSELLGARTCYRIEMITEAHPSSFTNEYFSDGLGNYSTSGSAVLKGMELEGNLVQSSSETAVPTIWFNLSWANVFIPFKLGPLSEVVRRPDEKIGDVDCYVVARTTPSNAITLWVGKQDFFIRRRQDRYIIETHENISTNETFSRADYIPAGVEPKHMWQ